MDQFKPLMLDKSKITAAQYLGINRGAIPKEKDIKKSGYYTTAVIFFLSRLQHKRYPICTDVLYALEMLIAFKLYNRMEVKDLLDKHIIYANQYKKAKEMGKLDNLLEYSKTGKVKSYFCADCDKFDICNDQSREIKTCKEKEQIMVTPK
ncbi:MAG: hypothetical protein GWN64_03805 [Candidatus Thorarchaeota archaeon]|nr:hypothetical protein [Candidatus Thorarchaeota archaeon]